jgi:hypothetical protein
VLRVASKGMNSCMDKFNAGCAKAVTITEGELDALSAYQMLGSKYPVVSLPSATPSGKLFEKCKDWLGSFEKIYLSFDSDGKSDGVAHKLANIFPNRVYNVPHDKYKDAMSSFRLVLLRNTLVHGGMHRSIYLRTYSIRLNSSCLSYMMKMIAATYLQVSKP